MAAAASQTKELTLTRMFEAPPEDVYKAWTDAKQLARWWGPKHFTNPVCEVDARVGGMLKIVMRAAWGSEHPMHGEFTEVVPNERLVFTNIATDQAGNVLLEGLTTVTFERHLGKLTKLVIQTRATPTAAAAGFAEQMLGGMEAGWSQSIDKLQSLLAPPDYGNGKICYIEIPTEDVGKSVAFYEGAFGWRVRTRGDGSVAFDDTVGQVSGRWRLGRRASAEVGMLVYIMVDDVQKTMAAIRAGGGKIVQEVGMDAPEITARFLDPYGNIFGLYQEPAKAKGA